MKNINLICISIALISGANAHAWTLRIVNNTDQKAKVLFSGLKSPSKSKEEAATTRGYSFLVVILPEQEKKVSDDMLNQKGYEKLPLYDISILNVLVGKQNASRPLKSASEMRNEWDMLKGDNPEGPDHFEMTIYKNPETNKFEYLIQKLSMVKGIAT